MSVTLPDPRDVAEQEAKRIRSVGYDVFELSVQRMLGDAPRAEPESLLRGIEDFHRERMAKVPPAATYPEAGVWVEHVTAVDRELQGILGLTPRQMAIHRSLGDFTAFRGFAQAKVQQVEKCRVVYIPETDRGQLHHKNVDDPAPPDWRPSRDVPEPPGDDAFDLMWDGVGSGLHIDDEPEQTFPLPIPRMCRHYANDVPSAVDFLTRYSQFYGGQNFVLHDKQQRSVAIEKCSRNFVEVFPLDPAVGFTHVSGMCCRDPESPQGRHQKAKRDQYRERFGLAEDGSDAVFWAACDRA